ncbi:MAG TPA: class I adenylate-forming enzyme family protein [Candidatus Dormibacteraeota bacterium]|nr:class I adenylate-forming enzyme family protein [Candidatus Dormibacteraeota bacterium]
MKVAEPPSRNRVRTLVEALLYQADEWPNSPFLHDVESGVRLTYSEAERRAAAFASLLASHRVGAGDRVAIALENRSEWVVAFLGCLWAGAVPVPINTRWGRDEVSAALADCEPALVLSEARHRASIGQEFHDRVIDADDLPRKAPALLPSPRSSSEALGLITYTSGTTGTPKGVMLSQGSLFLSSAYYAGLFNSGRDLATAITVPLFHNTGFIDGLGHAIVAGGSVDLYRRFSPTAIGRHLAAGSYSFFIGVPTMYTRLAGVLGRSAGGNADPWLAYGGGLMPNDTPARLRQAFPEARFVNCYGLSEATSITHYMPWRLAEGRWDATGIPVPGTWDRIADAGELLIQSPTAMIGYWRHEEETATRFVNGWLRTGDLAARGPDGILRVLGRIDDVINRGGEKVAPFEIESALCELAEILEASVVGLPNPDLGQVPAALVVLRPGHGFDPRSIRDRLSERIADYKVPVLIRSIEALPRNANGKVLSSAVRTRLVREADGPA